MSAGHVVLVGMMGSGKTTVGRLLAQRTGLPFVDADEQIALRAGRSIAEVFASDGERAFRTLEAEVIGELLASGEPVVLAVGGGAVLDEATRSRMTAAATVVWLQVPPAALTARLGSGAGRPKLEGAEDLATTVARLDGERAGLYRSVAHIVVDGEGGDPDATADAVLDALAQLDGAPT